MELEWLYVIILIVVFIVIVLKVNVPKWYGEHYVVSGKKPDQESKGREKHED